MADENLGHRRQEQDVIVNAATDAFNQNVIGWRVDVPGGRFIPVEISEYALYHSAFDLISPILQMRLHRVKRVTDANLPGEVRDHAAAIATYFVRCCYQQMRESAKLRYSPIVRERMILDLQITRAHLPCVLSRMVAGFGPLIISDGHLKNTHLVPFMRPGSGSMNHDATDQTHPWITNVSTFLTAITALRLNPEVRITDVDFTSTEGSSFWTIWTGSPDDASLSTGFCILPESYYTMTDKLLATMLRAPLFRWPSIPLVPIDWSDNEHDVPFNWAQSRVGDYHYGVDVTYEGLAYRGDRHFYFPAELLCAQIVSRPDHMLVQIPTGGSAQAESPPHDGDGQALTTRGSKRARTDGSSQGATTSVFSTTTQQQVKIGYAGFYGVAFEGISDDVSTQNFFKANALM